MTDIREELRLSKSTHLEQRQQRRDSLNSSVIEALHLNFEVPKQLSNEPIPSTSISAQDKPEDCAVCNGEGKVKSLFNAYECGSCHGTGFDLSEPLKVILWQSACLSWAKQTILKQRHTLKTAHLTRAENEQAARDKMYKKGKID